MKDFFENLYNNVTAGGIIVVDDYGETNNCNAIKPFVDYFLKNKNNYELECYEDPTENGYKHAIIKVTDRNKKL